MFLSNMYIQTPWDSMGLICPQQCKTWLVTVNAYKETLTYHFCMNVLDNVPVVKERC
jgi:hypothetical protein